MTVHIMDDGFAFILGLFKSLVSEVQLVGEVVNVPLQSVNFLDARLFSSFHISDTKLAPVNLLFQSLHP